MENKITASISNESLQKITDAIKTIYQELPFLIQLTPAETKRIIRMEAGRSEFVRKALSLASSNERLRPQFFELGELDKDINLCDVFDEIIASFNGLMRQLNDTRNQAGHEAYSAALEVYNTTKRATSKGIPGAQVAYDELRMMFDRQGKTAKTDPPPVQ